MRLELGGLSRLYLGSGLKITQPKREYIQLFSTAANTTGAGGIPVAPLTGTDGYVLTYVAANTDLELKAPTGFANPMTTPADIIVGGTAGAPARLAKGSDGQVLTVDPSTHLLLWATPTGFANPMTTAADIIVGGTSGAPARLAKGSDSQVLTVSPSTHLLVWATPTPAVQTTKGDLAGYSTVPARIPIGTDGNVLTADSTQTLGLKWAGALTNPMTTKGDIILGDTSGTPTRLAAGTSAYVLTSNGAAAFPSWQAGGGGGGGSTNAPDGKPWNFTVPGSPTSLDDEFGDASGQSGPINGLAGKWTKHNMGTAGWLTFSDTKAPGCGLFAIATGQASDQSIYQTTPAGNFTMTARFAMSTIDTSRQMWALYAVDTSGNGISVSVDVYYSEFCLRPLSAWAQTGSATDIFPGGGGTPSAYLGGAVMAGLPITVSLRKASGVYYGSITVGDRLLAAGNLEASVTPSAFTNAYVGFGRTYTGGGAMLCALDYFRQTA